LGSKSQGKGKTIEGFPGITIEQEQKEKLCSKIKGRGKNSRSRGREDLVRK